MNGEGTIRTGEVVDQATAPSDAVDLREEARAIGPDGEQVAATTRPAGADSYTPWWKIWLPIPLIFVLLDVGFDAYFWKIPKLTGTADDYSYQFLYDLHDLQSFRPDGVRVLAFGSSVTASFDPYQIGGLVDREVGSDDVEVRRILRPGTKPSDYRLLWSTEIDAVDPDVVVPVFNLVDYIKPGFENNLKPGIRYVLPPWPTLKARWEQIPKFSEKLEMVLASVSNLYRYRKPIKSTIKDHVKLLLAWWKGGGGQTYGVFADGFTKPRFGVPGAREIEYFVDPRWIDQRGRARLRFLVDGEVVAERDENEPGWHRIDLGEAGEGSAVVDVEVEGGWTPRASGDDDIRLLGVRLPQSLAADVSRRRPPLRYPPVAASDIKQLMRMGAARGEDYARKWSELLEAETEFGHRYRLYRDAKIDRSRRPFVADDEFEEMRLMAEGLAARGIRVVMVNTPENPVSPDVVSSQFYADYLAFFESIAESNDRIDFVDLHGEVEPEDLNDWHHLNFAGQLKVGPVIAERLAPVVEAALAEKAGAS